MNKTKEKRSIAVTLIQKFLDLVFLISTFEGHNTNKVVHDITFTRNCLKSLHTFAFYLSYVAINALP